MTEVGVETFSLIGPEPNAGIVSTAEEGVLVGHSQCSDAVRMTCRKESLE